MQAVCEPLQAWPRVGFSTQWFVASHVYAAEQSPELVHGSPVNPTATQIPAVPPPPVTPAADPEPPPEVLEELARKPALAAVDRLVRQCFDDASDRIHEPQRVTVTFGTTDAGRFENVAIKKSSWPDPQVTACVIDSFEEARFESAGRPLRRQSHTFTFSPAHAGH